MQRCQNLWTSHSSYSFEPLAPALEETPKNYTFLRKNWGQSNMNKIYLVEKTFACTNFIQVYIC